MLVLTRKEKETVKIGNDTTVTILKTLRGRVRIGISAPKDTPIVRDNAKVKSKKPP